MKPARKRPLARFTPWVLAGLIAGHAVTTLGDVVITEVMYDTVGVETGSAFGEWVEVFNTGPTAVDLTGWSLEKDNVIDGVDADPLSLYQGSTTLLPGQFALIVPGGGASVSTSPLLETWAIPDRITVFTCEWTLSHNLGNSGETIALRDALNVAVDVAAYPDLGTNVGSVQVSVSAINALTNDVPGNWVQSDTVNADYCPDPISVSSADFGFLDDNPANDFWDGVDENRDLGTPGRYPRDLKYDNRYEVDYGAPLVQTQGGVRGMIDAFVIQLGINADDVCGYDFPLPFPAGTRVSAPDGSAPDIVLPATTWVAWLDDDALSAFVHPTRYVLVDDASGTIAVLNAGWWIEINDEPYFELEEDRLCSANQFAGNCCSGPGFEFPPPPLFAFSVDEDEPDWALAGGACAIAISGSSESHFSKNVDNFTKALQDKGLVTEARTTKVKYPNSRLRAVCKAFDNLPNDCDKLFVYVASHGSRNSIALPGPNLTARKLAKKIKDKNVADNCIVLQACKSGSFVDELKGKKIPGSVTTSADSSHSSYFKRDMYSYYTQYIIDCLKLNTISTLKQASAWAKQQLMKNRPEDKSNPQCADLATVAIKQDDGAEVQELGTTGEGINYQFESEGSLGGPESWSLDPPAIAPAGLSLSPTGLLSGILSQPGQFDYTVRLFDCCTPDGVAFPATLQVIDPFSSIPPLLVDPPLPPAIVGLNYVVPLDIRGGLPPYNVSIIHGALPPGFAIIPEGPETVLIAGFAEFPFESEITLQVQDNGFPQQVAIRNTTFEVVEPNPRPSSGADINYTGDVGPDDWALMADCMTGPINSAPLMDLNVECQLSDLDGDEDIDLVDAEILFRAAGQ